MTASLAVMFPLSSQPILPTTLAQSG